MKRIVTLIVATLVSAASMMAEDHVKDEVKSGKAENIIGTYLIEDEEGNSRAEFYKEKNGTYCCRTLDGKPVYDENGKLKLDEFNPDPAYRNIPLHKAVIITGLKYNAEEKQWDGGKIHHPLKKMMKANCTVDFVDGGKIIRVRGHVAGIGQSKYWKCEK